MSDIAAGLRDAGLAADLARTAAGLHVIATSGPPGHQQVEVIVDEDLYIELRWWADPGATPAEVTGAVTAVVRTAAAASPAPARPGVPP
jgi:hypothetical protein